MVAEKNIWSHKLSRNEEELGFRGWHERGFLPHCDFPNLIQLLTIRLSDSLPISRKREWEHLLKLEDDRERRMKLEEYLDKGFGKCWLRRPAIARLCEEALLHFHRKRFELLAWCVMPNHIHVLVDVWNTPLWKMIKSWKQFVSTQAQSIVVECQAPVRHEVARSAEMPGRRPALQSIRWQREYWDTFMRNGEQSRKATRYIENNPVRAGLCRKPEDWQYSSARFRDTYGQLQLGQAV